MLSGKQKPVLLSTPESNQSKLEQLYARRTAIDELIASLMAYDRYRMTPARVTVLQRRSA
jgi:hypothetical protein